jgi:hypothetical protein
MTNQHTPPNTSHTYPDAIIYGIKCGETGEVYIGSTIRTLKQRMKSHAESATRYNAGKCPSRCCSIQILNRDNYKYFEIEPYPCNTKPELCLREGDIQIQYKKEFGSLCINERVAGAHARAGGKDKYRKKRYIDNADKIRQQTKQYYIENSSKIAARDGVKHNCSLCGGIYTHGHRARHFRTQKHQRAEQASAHHDS